MEERQQKSQMSRLDYFLISPEFYGFVAEADIDISYIPKVITEEGKELLDQKAILREQNKL